MHFMSKPRPRLEIYVFVKFYSITLQFNSKGRCEKYVSSWCAYSMLRAANNQVQA